MSVVDHLLNSLIKRLQKSQKARKKRKDKKRLTKKPSHKVKKSKLAKKPVNVDRRKRDREKKRAPGRSAKRLLKKSVKVKKKKTTPRKAPVQSKSKAKKVKKVPKIKKVKKVAKVKRIKKVKKVVKKVSKVKKGSKETLIGEVTHFFSGIKVIVLKMNSGKLIVGDQIHILGRNVSFVQKVKSLQIESVDVKSARKGQLVGLKVSKKARPGDQVFKV